METIERLEVYELNNVLPLTYCEELCARNNFKTHHTDEEGHGTVANKDLYLPFAARRIFNHIDITLNTTSTVKHIPNLCSVDPMMKIYKLERGMGIVSPHRDQDYENDLGLKALYSVLIYLNEDYQGGGTVFNQGFAGKHPRTGDCLVFKHDILHEGREVTWGTKYVLKTDLFVE